eukprot:TRINITY_DN826_c0_g1_i1.p1 TRINITY_DN826_c0_g1~~TRINITY_DN826_c0_g1_i1.p1  ORF type:complete len:126 (-),score=55.65 TRINITY_DN826_c0_g1_i1:101-433(-)
MDLDELGDSEGMEMTHFGEAAREDPYQQERTFERPQSMFDGAMGLKVVEIRSGLPGDEYSTRVKVACMIVLFIIVLLLIIATGIFAWALQKVFEVDEDIRNLKIGIKGVW